MSVKASYVTDVSSASNALHKAALVFVLVLCTAMSAFAFIDSYTIKREQLPETARSFLDEHFPKAKVSTIKIDRHLLKKTDYDVRLTCGSSVEFSNKGEWQSVDCGKRAVPEAVVPSVVRRAVDKRYGESAKIVRIAKKNVEYCVTLGDGTELRISRLGTVKVTAPESAQ